MKTIDRGYDLIDEFASTDNFGKEWDKTFTTECMRDTIELVK